MYFGNHHGGNKMTCWNVDIEKNEMFMLKCMNPRCSTGQIVDDYVACPDCGECDVHITKHIHDLGIMGITETREFTRNGDTENGVCFHEKKNSRHITTGEIVLTPGFASNAKKIRVTINIIE
jgi:hypothetical protein